MSTLKVDTIQPNTTSDLAMRSWSGWIDADETWTYASADDPTYTFTVAADVTTKYSAGMRIKLAQSSTVKYFIITAVSTYSGGNTTITIYGGTDYDLANSAISANYYSTMKTPQGFPLDPTKWTVEVTDSTARSQASPTANVWYNLGSISISIPIGIWFVSYQVNVRITSASAVDSRVHATLSTANNSSIDDKYTTICGMANVSTLIATMQRNFYLTIASKTTYYLNSLTSTSSVQYLYNENQDNDLILRAVCAYL